LPASSSLLELSLGKEVHALCCTHMPLNLAIRGNRPGVEAAASAIKMNNNNMTQTITEKTNNETHKEDIRPNKIRTIIDRIVRQHKLIAEVE
jgi:hypothetical protein